MNYVLRLAITILFFLSALTTPLPVYSQSFNDEDNDNMDDNWELEYGLLVGRDDSLDDPDGDGFSNIMEYAGSSHPNDISKVPNLSIANIDFEDPSHLDLIQVEGADLELVSGAGTYGSTALRITTHEGINKPSITLAPQLASRGVVIRAKSEIEDERVSVSINYRDQSIASMSVPNRWAAITNFVASLKLGVREQEVKFVFNTRDTVLIDDIFFITYDDKTLVPDLPEHVEMVSIDEDGNNLIGSFMNVLHSVSPLGNWVAFTSNNNVYIRNLDSSVSKQILSDTHLDSSAFSYDGRFFAYSPFDSGQLFVHDTELEQTTDFSQYLNDAQNVDDRNINLNRFIEMNMSANGRFISLISRGNLDGVEGGTKDYKVFAFDTITRRVTRDSTGDNGELAFPDDDGSSLASLSANGRFHYFRSRAKGFTDKPLSDGNNLFLKDRKTGELRVVNKDMKFNITPVQGAGIGTLAFDGKSASFSGSREPYAPNEPWYTWRSNPAFALYRDFDDQETRLFSAFKDIEGYQGSPGSFFINAGVFQSIDNRLAFSVISRAFPINDLVFTGNGRRSASFTISDLITGQSKAASINKYGMHFDLNNGYKISADGRYAFFQTQDPRALPGYFSEAPDGGYFIVRVDFGEQNLILDSDLDGVPDFVDEFPFDNNEFLDSDWDSIGDNADPDDDNDGMPDVYETRVGLNPLVADADEDADGDGLTNLEEFEYGTDPFNTDSDGDGINDKLDNNPTVPDDSNASELGSGIPLLWQDVNGDGVTELGVFSVVDDVPTLAVMNLVNNAELSRITWAADAYLPSSMTPIALPDMDNDDVMDIGLFGIRQDDGNEGKPQFFVRSGRTGNRLSVFNWPANWKNMRVVVMDDLTGDGVPEIALEGTFKDGARPQLRVQNGSTGANVGVYSFPAIFDSPSYYQHSDYDGDGVRDVALFGRIKRNNKIQVKLISGANSNDKLDAYNFPDKWENVSWHKLFDMNNDDNAEWGLFGISRDDGRTMLLVKDAADKRGLVASYAWPGMDSPTLLTIPDISGDGTPELAAAGLNTATNRYQLQIKDGSDRNNTLNNITWPNRYSDVSFHVFNDMDDDGLADVVLQGLNTTSGNYELVIVNAVNRNTITTINLGSDWDSAPTVYQVGDTDGDGVPNVVVFGLINAQAVFKLH